MMSIPLPIPVHPSLRRPPGMPEPADDATTADPGRLPAMARAHRQYGLSVVELMISLTLGLLMLAGVVRMYASAGANARTNSSLSEYQSNGRYALDTLQREIRHAALRPLVWSDSQVQVSPDAAAEDFGCGAGVTIAIGEGLRSSDNSNAYPTTCLQDSSAIRYARGDVVTLRRLALDPVTAFQNGAPYARVSYGQGAIFLGGESPPAPNGPTYDYPVVNDIYYINTFTNSGSESPKVPALYRLRLSAGANPVLVPEMIAANVEHIRLQFVIGDGTDARKVVPASDVSDWSQVTATRVWLLLRSSMPEGDPRAQSHVLGDVTYKVDDAYRRTVLTTTISLRAR